MAKGEKRFSFLRVDGLGVNVEVFVITQGEGRGEFKAKYGNQTFQEQTFAELERKLVVEIGKNSKLPWIAIVAIYLRTENTASDDEPARYATLFSYERFHAARRSNGTWVRSAWGVEPSQRLIRCEELRGVDHGEERQTPQRSIDFGKLPDSARGYCSSSNYKETTYYLPYDEALFEGLKFVGSQIVELEQRFGELLNSDSGRRAIARNDVELLPGS